jgi:site-specific recombinase XerC
MGRRPKPWWWEERQGYYATVRGVRYRLATTKKAADDELKSLLTKAPEKELDTDSVTAILDDFLDWTQENRAPKTYRGYKDFCQSFTEKYPLLKIGALTPLHVTAWLQGTTWNSTTKRGAITCLQRAFNWATKNRGLGKNPLRGMEKPEAKTRTTVVIPEEFVELLKKIPDREFRELLIVSYDCGCRPQEVKWLEARHVDLAKHRWVLPAAEAKGKKRPRVVYIATDRSLKIITRRITEYPHGRVFRNSHGNPWSASAVKIRFEKLEIQLGIEEMQRRGVASSITDEAIEKFARALSPLRRCRSTGTKCPKSQWELRHEAKRKLIAKEAKRYGRRFRQCECTERMVASTTRAALVATAVALQTT